MAFPTRPTDNIEWAEDGASLVDEPVGERTRGFPFGYIPPVDQANWLQRAVGRWIEHLKGSGGAFDSLPELIDALEPGELSTLAPPDLKYGREINKIESSEEILDIATDGGILWYVTTSATANQILLMRKDLLADSAPTTADTISDVDLTENALLETNGDVVILFCITDVDKESLVEAYNRDGTSRWSIQQSGASNQSSISMVLSGTKVYSTVQFSGTPSSRTTRVYATADGTSSTGLVQNLTEVRATNGTKVAFSVGVDGIEVFDSTLSSSWTATVGGTTTPQIAMDSRRLYVSVDSADSFFIYSLQAALQLQKASGDFAYGPVFVDSDDLFLLSSAGPGAVFSFPKDVAPASFEAAWTTFPSDFDSLVSASSDSSAVYIAGETTTTGDYAIWVIAKGQAPKIWRRLDPTDDDSWPRTLAAPI